LIPRFLWSTTFLDFVHDLKMSDCTAYVDPCRALTAEAEDPALERAVGTGRVAVTVASAGVPMVGFDHSEKVFTLARAKIASVGLDVRLHRADMRHTDLGRWSLRGGFLA
jgi:cyclopropane fatty-acyl-phospholipid synthase-like methyltransferase